jgi:hypothetical protein
MAVEIYKKRMGYVARGTHAGKPYSFAGFTAIEAIEKALTFIGAK